MLSVDELTTKIVYRVATQPGGRETKQSLREHFRLQDATDRDVDEALEKVVDQAMLEEVGDELFYTTSSTVGDDEPTE